MVTETVFEGSQVDHLLREAPGSDTLVIVFSSINIPRGKYGFYRFFGECNENILFINSPGNQWFQPDIDQIQILIDLAKAKTKTQRVHYYGSSMGAYASALFSMLRNDGPSLSFGPNVELGILGAHSARYEISFDERYKNLSLLDPSGEHEITVIFGAFDLVDAVGYANLRSNEKINTKLIPSCHAIHEHLFNTKEIFRLRDQFLINGSVDTSWLPTHEAAKSDDALKAKCLNYEVWANRISEKPQHAPERSLTILDPGDAFFESRLCQLNGAHSKALEHITNAIDCINSDEWLSKMPPPYIGRYYFLRAESHRRLGHVQDSVSDYEMARSRGFKPQACLRFKDLLISA